MNYFTSRKGSERPIRQKRGSAEPNRFGQFDRRFGRTLAIFGQFFGQIFGPKLTNILLFISYLNEN